MNDWLYGISRQVSLLLANGHAHARHYPVGMVFVEAGTVVKRLDHSEATRAVLVQLAVSSMLSKDAGKKFQKIVDQMMQT